MTNTIQSPSACFRQRLLAILVMLADECEPAIVPHAIRSVAGVGQNASFLRPNGVPVARVLVIAVRRRRDNQSEAAVLPHTVRARTGVGQNSALLRPNGLSVARVLVVTVGGRHDSEDSGDEDGEESWDGHDLMLDVCGSDGKYLV